MKTILICQARSTNSRLPKKNFLKIGGKSIIEHHIKELSTWSPEGDVYGCEMADLGIIATPHNEPRLKDYQNIAKKYGWTVENPDCAEDDVLKRFIMICDKYQPDWVVRTTADCAFMDAEWVQKTIRMAIDNNIPVFNSFNEGSTVEVFPAWCLYRANSELLEYGRAAHSIIDLVYQNAREHRQHVTSYFKKGFNKGSIDTRDELKKAREEYGRGN